MNNSNIQQLVPIKPTSLAPTDVLKNIQDEEWKEKAHQENLIISSIKADKERALLQKKVYDISNPSPIFVTGIVIVILLIMYFIYVIFLKSCMSGEWSDHAGNIWYISHNKFTGNFQVKINNKNRGVGKVLDNYVRYGDLIGVWNYGNIIMFTEGWQLTRFL